MVAVRIIGITPVIPAIVCPSVLPFTGLLTSRSSRGKDLGH